MVVFLVVFPVADAIFDRVGKEPQAPTGRGRHGDHAAVFQESGFKHAFLANSVIEIEHTGSARPYLGYVSVHAFHGGQGGFGTHNLPLGVVDERMSGDITLDVPAQAFSILLGIGEGLVQGPVIQVVFEFGGEVSGFRRLMLGAPGGAVIGFPFPLERF